MPNLRIIYDNAADRANSLTASSTSGSLVAANMLNDIKGSVHRSVGLTVTYTLTWTTAQTIGGIALPATNLSSSATIRVRMYSDSDCTALLQDSGTIYACPGASLELWDWSLPLNANAFAFGGASKTTVWFSEMSGTVRGLKIDLVDINRTGDIDCARIICGAYWEPKHNVQNGSLNIEIADLSQQERTDSGDLLANRSVLHDKMRFDMSYLEETDRQQFMRIARLAGKSRNLVVTVFPDNTNSVLAQDTTVYGKITNFAQAQQFYGFYSMPLEIEGW